MAGLSPFAVLNYPAQRRNQTQNPYEDMNEPSNPIAKWEDGGVKGAIRITTQGQPSVIDMIRVLGGQKNPRQVWKRLIASHPEVVPKCDNLQFPGPGQRETPVARTKEDAYYILGLLPGAVGSKYREDAARTFVQALDDPAGLIERLRPRLTAEEEQWLETRLRGKRTRGTFTSALSRAGVSQNAYGDCTNAIYLPVLGHKASALKKIIRIKRNITTKKVSIRDNLPAEDLDRVEQSEGVAIGQLKRMHNRLQGTPRSAARDSHVEHICRTSAEYSEKLRQGLVAVPGLE